MGFQIVLMLICSFMDDITYVRDVEYDLLHTGVHLQWLCEFWIVISA
jgi:hypothetical protein